MAGSDPKTNRALGQTSNRADIDADEDPLVELARIVSEDGGFSGPRSEKPKMARSEPSDRDALGRRPRGRASAGARNVLRCARDTGAGQCSPACGRREKHRAGRRPSFGCAGPLAAERGRARSRRSASLDRGAAQPVRAPAGRPLRFAVRAPSAPSRVGSDRTNRSLPRRSRKSFRLARPTSAAEPHEEWQGRRGIAHPPVRGKRRSRWTRRRKPFPSRSSTSRVSGAADRVPLPRSCERRLGSCRAREARAKRADTAREEPARSATSSRKLRPSRKPIRRPRPGPRCREPGRGQWRATGPWRIAKNSATRLAANG